jgi:hypothetical protein
MNYLTSQEKNFLIVIAIVILFIGMGIGGAIRARQGAITITKCNKTYEEQFIEAATTMCSNGVESYGHKGGNPEIKCK